jgi:hypothetical protein
MVTGMLWFDNDPKSDLNSKIVRAVDFYQKKYGIKPDLCFVHPTMVKGEAIGRIAVEIRTNTRVLPHHFWIGKND